MYGWSGSSPSRAHDQSAAERAVKLDSTRGTRNQSTPLGKGGELKRSLENGRMVQVGLEGPVEGGFRRAFRKRHRRLQNDTVAFAENDHVLRRDNAAQLQ